MAVVWLLLVVAFVLGRSQEDEMICRHAQCAITDKHVRGYVSEREIVALIRKEGLLPIGNRMDEVDLQPIEDVVRSHAMVRTAECYKAKDSTLYVRLSQRIPLLRVICANESYLVDTDRKRMPLPPIFQERLLIVRGVVGLNAATTTFADFATWLKNDPYWSSRIVALEANAVDDIYVRQCPDPQTGDARERIRLGSMTDYEQKLTKAKKYYDKTALLSERPTYRVLDVRYKNQVIGVK